MNRVAFLALDESACTTMGVASLTGVLFPVELYGEFRAEYYAFQRRLAQKPDNHITMPFHLHAKELLNGMPWATDRHRLDCFRFAADVINRYALRVVRVGYFIRTMPKHIFKDRSLRGTHYANIFFMLTEELASTLVIPIFDGVERAITNTVGMQAVVNQMTATLVGANCSIPNAHNVCETYFVSSDQSALIQLADLVSYMLHVKDWRDSDLPMSDFKEEIYRVSQSIEPELLRNEIIAMKFDGPSTN